jgi:hypothetical protein
MLKMLILKCLIFLEQRGLRCKIWIFEMCNEKRLGCVFENLNGSF